MLEAIEPENCVPSVKSLDFGELPTQKVLYVLWDANVDVLMMKVEVQLQPLTQRGVLSVLSQVYDPSGMVQPFLSPARRFM